MFDNIKLLIFALFHNPQGIYYGGTIAAPVLRSIFDNVLRRTPKPALS